MAVTASTPDSIVKIWDVESGKLLHNITTHCTWINSATFSANGARILISFGMGYSIMYDVQSEKEIFEIDGSSPAVFSPDEKNITTSSNGSLVCHLLLLTESKNMGCSKWKFAAIASKGIRIILCLLLSVLMEKHC